MRVLWAVGVLGGVSLTAGQVRAAPIESEPSNADGAATQAITWTDASGLPRTVHVLANNHRIVRYEYTVDGAPVVDTAVGDYGIGNLVNHGGCDAGAVASWEGESEYTAEAVLAGRHHFIWRSTFRYFMCSHPDTAWRVTNDYLFTTGSNEFVQAVSFDSSDLPANMAVGDDMRGPYNQTTWPGDGVISGFGWGSEYKFVTTSPIADGDANVAGGVVVDWDWTEPNTIPYVWEWADREQGAAVDREYGIVQNQPYAEQDFGGGYYVCEGCFESLPPTVGTSLPAAWAMPSQMNSYDSNYRSGRITWGQTYGTFENGHANDTGTIEDMGDRFRPINAWSFTHVVGKYSDHGLEARVRDTENAYESSLVATTGQVHTEGPRGPGNFVGPSVGTMPIRAWSNPGLDFVYRTWNITASSGEVMATLHVNESLVHPVLVIHEFPDAMPVVALDGVALGADSDYFSSYDAMTGRLWITLNFTLADGVHDISVFVSDEPEGEGGSDGAGGDLGMAGQSGDSSSSTSGTAGPGGSGGNAGHEDTNATSPTSGSPSGSTTGSSSTSSNGATNGQAGSPGSSGPPASDDSGCGCRVTGSGSHSSSSLGVLFLMTFSAFGRRRSRRACWT